ncbi:hypothetical protein EJ419_02660 [Alloscardovia theropitheci]|uniref:LPXTG cell wall anchor domain-containing protein n=1 Tax=Alloscardovia theropitheci TaxID=2496842 RepID=A0A4R0QY78_9BIFI|nr:hypothetical protein [Alloscardovia theropitheci]TCD54521.1 hypothetical protein EJ419_02660 [Alloscardovia theropitheci]
MVCEVPLLNLGSIQLVDQDGNVVATKRYDNDTTNISRVIATSLPAVPTGYEIVPGQTVYGYNEATGMVDANNPANRDAIGANTVIRVQRVAAPTPTPTPTPQPQPVVPATPKPEEPKALAKTGTSVAGIAIATALVTIAGAALVVRKKIA